ncbi:hypothetical protein ACU8OH_32970 (plasmid) [Rhizobium leguminosarum]
MFTLLKLRHRALVSATPSVPIGNQAKCLIEWGKFTGQALWSVAGENENQPLDTHHRIVKRCCIAGAAIRVQRFEAVIAASSGLDSRRRRAACSAEPISHILDIKAFNRRVSWIGLMQCGFCLR